MWYKYQSWLLPTLACTRPCGYAMTQGPFAAELIHPPIQSVKSRVSGAEITDTEEALVADTSEVRIKTLSDRGG